MASLLDRISSYLNRPRKPVSPNIKPSTPINWGQVGRNLQQSIRPLAAAPRPSLTQNLRNSVTTSLPILGVAEGFLSKRPQSLTGQYTRGQITNPIKQGASQVMLGKSAADRGFGGLQVAGGLFSATPAGVAFNAGFGGLTGALRSARTGQNLEQSMRQAMTTPTSLSREGLGVNNGALALGIDVLTTRNPKAIVKDPTALKAIGKNLKGAKDLVTFIKAERGVPKGVSPRANQVHPMDVADIEAAFDVINSQSGASQTAKRDAWKTLQNVAEAYTPGYKNASNQKVRKTAEWLLDRYYKEGDTKLPKLDDLPLGAMGFAATSPRRVPQTFKADKLAVSATQAKALTRLQKALGLESRNVRSFDDMRAAAEELGTDPRRLLKDIENGRITDKEVIALGNTISTSSKRIASLSRQLKKNPSDATLQQQLRAEEEIINQAISKRIKGGTEAGRSVAAFRVIANKTMDPAYWLDKAKRQIGTEQDVPADVISAINEFITKNDRLGLARFVSKLGESSGLEKAIGLWKAGLLTGFRTHEANIVSNAAFGALETVKDIPATGFDIARSLVTGGPRAKSFGLRNVTGQLTGARKGAGRALTVLKEGSDPADLARAEFRRELRFGNTRGGRMAQAMTNAVFRTLGAEDKVFYGSAFQRSLEEQARTAGINQKLNRQGVRALVENPTEEMLANAAKDASYATFTSDNAIADAVRAAKAAGGPGVSAAMDILMPFVKTPTNVAKSTFIDYTPVGAVKTVAQKLFNRESVSDRELADAFGRASTGTAALWLGVELAKRGLVTGPSSASASERAQNDLEGEPPNSVFINGAWRSASRISPMGNLVLLGAQIFNSGGNLTEAAFAGVKGLSEQSFLKGVGSGLKALNEPDRFANSFVENTVSGYVPTLVADVARGLDSHRRDPEGIGERIMSRLPGLSERVPAKLSPLGDPVENEAGFFGSLFDPFNSRQPTDDPLVQEMSRVGYNLNYVGDTIDGQELNRDQQREYQRVAGRYIKELLPGVVGSPSYQGLDTDTQRSVLERMVNRAKDLAREDLLARGLDTIVDERGQVDAAGGGLANGARKPYVFYDAANDQVKVIDTDFSVEAPELTGNAALDKKLVSEFKSEITSKINDVVDLYKEGHLSAVEAEALVAQLEQSRSGVGGGSGGSGGATKSQIASAIGKVRTAAEDARPSVSRSKRPRIAERSLGTLSQPSQSSQRSLVNAARVASAADIDELIRRYGGASR